MENRDAKIMAIAALIVGVVGITIGFAAFSTSLKISSSATVTATNDTFANKVYFTVATVNEDTQEVTCSTTKATTVAGTLGGTGTVGASGVSLDVKATGFKAPGEIETYTVCAYNDSPYEALLTTVDVGTVNTADCPIYTEADQTNKLASEACNSLEMSITVHGVEYTEDATNVTTGSIPAGESVPVVVTVKYPSTAPLTDQTIKVDFSESSLTYNTAR